MDSTARPAELPMWELPMRELPILELLVGPQLPAGIADVLVCAAHRCAPRAAGPGVQTYDHPDDHPDARLATSLDAPGLRAALDDPTVPLAVLVDRDPTVPDSGDAHDLHAAAVARADVVLAPTDRTAAAPAGALRLPGVDPWRHRPVAPFVRAGWRERLDFPAEFVVAFGFSPATAVGGESAATVLALASAAAVRGELALVALALGTPVVTDAATAAAIGAVDGRDLLVVGSDHGGDDTAAIAAARALATRPVECARLGRQARAFVEAHHDPEVVARELVERLGLAGEPAPPAEPGSAAILQTACRELGLPPDGSLLAYRLLIAGRMERVPR